MSLQDSSSPHKSQQKNLSLHPPSFKPTFRFPQTFLLSCLHESQVILNSCQHHLKKSMAGINQTTIYLFAQPTLSFSWLHRLILRFASNLWTHPSSIEKFPTFSFPTLQRLQKTPVLSNPSCCLPALDPVALCTFAYCLVTNLGFYFPPF